LALAVGARRFYLPAALGPWKSLPAAAPTSAPVQIVQSCEHGQDQLALRAAGIEAITFEVQDT
jgi:hypothetical protein